MWAPKVPPVFEKKGCFLVGGAVRDLLLGRRPFDYDILCADDARQQAGQAARVLGGTLVELGRPGQTLYRVVSPQGVFDLSPMRGQGVAEDLGLRDFTINAMAWDLCSHELIDPLNGAADLEKKQVRMVSEKAFSDDPLRMLRAYRMGAGLGFAIDEKTASAISRQKQAIAGCAGERVREEWFKTLKAGHSLVYLRQMAETGLLTEIFPELGPLAGCPQNAYHRFDVLEHSLSAYGWLEQLFRRPAPLSQAGALTEAVSPPQRVWLKTAILLHDSGKPRVQSSDENGGIHFYGHEQAGEPIATEVCQRLRCSNAETRFIAFVVRHHLRPLFLFTAKNKGKLSQKGITRFFLASGPWTPHLLLHALADHHGKGDQPPDGLFPAFVDELARRYFQEFKPRFELAPLLTGTDLIEQLGLVPSPLFKQILGRVQEAQLAGRIQDKAEALAAARQMAAQASPK